MNDVLYSLVRMCLFRMNPETAHILTLELLKTVNQLHLSKILLGKPISSPRTVMGLQFDNPVGIAAGLDKNGDYIDALASLGVGFIEIGTVTPKAQVGNPRPRISRIPKEKAIINRMGFNNKGIEYLLHRLELKKYKGIIGVNIGKNFSTPIEHAFNDYQFCYKRVYQKASYVCINLSSPNTPGLRELQFGKALHKLLSGMKNTQSALADEFGYYVPLVVKLAPDIAEQDLFPILDEIVEVDMDGINVANTTIQRMNIEQYPEANEAGGLSGQPLKSLAEAMLTKVAEHIQGTKPIISVGGIMTPDSALSRLAKGASLVQLYSGLIYEGPSLITSILKQESVTQQINQLNYV